MSRKIKKNVVGPMLLVMVLVLSLILSTATIFFVKNKISKEEAKMPESAITLYLQEIKNGKYDIAYDNSLIVDPHYNSKEDYIGALKTMFNDIDFEQLTFQKSIQENVYDLIYNDTLLTSIKVVEKDGKYIPSTLFKGDNTYYIEVPHGENLTINGFEVNKDSMIEENTTPNNFDGISKQFAKPSVDVYEVSNLISEPTINTNSYNETLKDPLSNTLFVGQRVNDEILKSLALTATEAIVRFPAEDGSLQAIANLSITSSDFYNRVRTLQNEWFTPHNIARFDKLECTDLFRQSDNSFVANVVWDYYISNGSLERTYHGGYQLTFIDVNGSYKIAGLVINNQLNPANAEVNYD